MASTRFLGKSKVGRPKPATASHVYGPPVVVKVKVTIKALAFQEADGGYSVVVPELPGCVTEGDTIEEVRETAEGSLAVMHDRHRDERARNVTEPLPGAAGA